MEETQSSKRSRNMTMDRLHLHHRHRHHHEEEGFARLMTSYRGHKGGVTCLCFRPLMKHLVSGGSDGSVLLWSLFCRPGLSRQTQIRPYRFLGHQVLTNTECPICLFRLVHSFIHSFIHHFANFEKKNILLIDVDQIKYHLSRLCFFLIESKFSLFHFYVKNLPMHYFFVHMIRCRVRCVQ